MSTFAMRNFARAFAWLVVVALASLHGCLPCSATASQGTPCTPESAGFSSKDAVTLTPLTLPGGCDLVHVDGEGPPEAEVSTITDEASAEALYSCASDAGTGGQASGVDFTKQEIVVVTSASLGDVPPTVTWSVKDAKGFHLGVPGGLGCGGAVPGAVSAAFLVDAGAKVDATTCRESCGSCAFLAP